MSYIMQVDIHMNGEHMEQYEAPNINTADIADDSPHQIINDVPGLPSGPNSYRLEDLAYTRSGDKGNNCNIGMRKDLCLSSENLYHNQ